MDFRPCEKTFHNCDRDPLSCWDFYTRRLFEAPTDPSLWCNRALINLKLSIYELSYIDAFKAQSLLTSADDNFPNSIANGDFRFSKRLLSDPTLQHLLVKSYDYMSESLYRSGLVSRAVSVLDLLFNHREYSKFLTQNAREELTNKRKEYQARINEQLFHNISFVLEVLKNKNIKNFKKFEIIGLTMNMGTCKFEYPWDKKRFMDRVSSGRVRILQHKLNSISSKKVRIERLSKQESNGDKDSILTTGLAGRNSSVHLGIFAQEDILEGSVIWSEDPFLTIHDYKSPKCNNCARKLKSPEHPPIFNCQNNNSCKEIFCSHSCYNIAMSKYHIPLCGKTLSPILSILDGQKSDPSPLFILKIFSIAKISNIHPLDIPQIRDLAQYQPPPKSGNSFLPVYYFNLYLETLRILDRDPVLADYEFRHNSMEMMAVRDIKRGEEIVVRYCDPSLKKWDRAMHLIPVYGFECRCKKCEEEEPDDLK
ncbi:11362_t:CDS:2, partial [Acaulospora colombiana]